MLKNAEQQGRIKGLKLTPTSRPLSHLFFADDVILFAKVIEVEAYDIISILNKFSLALRQRINIKKNWSYLWGANFKGLEEDD